jgi:2-keto-4-pentenoate hydratase/2-oxohepta-3-ene-1,7-dioic acid hydratase in catechol pathway
MFFLAGNYAKHVVERGGSTAERDETFPYVFMKPASTTLTHPGDPILIPRVSPQQIDWECELGVVIGRRCRHVDEDEAMVCIAGYTIINDISDRSFKPNPKRTPRDRDKFFDWLHGKWHDTFCPMGPCILSADVVANPQALGIELTVNGQVKQSASTAEMVFPVPAIVAFLSEFVTLQPGDVIATGTPAGVGSASGTFLRAGDDVRATIDPIGTLQNPVEDENEDDL